MEELPAPLVFGDSDDAAMENPYDLYTMAQRSLNSQMMQEAISKRLGGYTAQCLLKEFNGFDGSLETCSIDDVDAALDAIDATFLKAEILALRKIRMKIDPLVWQSFALLFAPVPPSVTQPIDDAARGSLDSASAAYVAARGCLADL